MPVYYMQNNIVVGSICLVSVFIPLSRCNMQFHITCPQGVAYADARIAEIRTGMMIVRAGMQHLNRFSVGGYQAFIPEKAHLPDKMQ